MKSPFLYFLPAALGAAGIYWLVDPGRTVALVPDAAVPGSLSGSGNRESGARIPSRLPGDPEGMRTRGDGGEGSGEIGRPTDPRTSTARLAASGSGGEPAIDPPPSRKSRLSRAQLEARAREVETQANRELERLIPALGLTEAQQQRIFAVLVRHSPAFHPAMRVESASPDGGAVAPVSPSRSREDDLYAALDSGQQVVLEEIYEDQSAWWQDVVEQLVGDDEIPGLPGDGEPPMMADDKPGSGAPAGKDVTGTVRPPSS